MKGIKMKKITNWLKMQFQKTQSVFIMLIGISIVSALLTKTDIPIFNWIHQTGKFKIEWEWNINESQMATEAIFANRGAAANGMFMYRSSIDGRIIINFGSGGNNILQASWDNIFNGSFSSNKFVIIGDGSGIELFSNGVSKGYKPFTGTIVNSGNALTNMAFCGLYGTNIDAYNLKNRVRNIKFYDENNNLKYFFPLTDNINIGKDVIGGLTGTITGTINVVDL
jgi:hypothetical protein